VSILEFDGGSPPLSDVEASFLESLDRAVQNEILQRAAEVDSTGEFPWANIETLNEIGANSIFIPSEYDGAGLSYAAYLKCLIEISKACASTGITWATNFHAAIPLLLYAGEAQKRAILPKIAGGSLAAVCLTEPGAGSDATAMKTRFVPAGDNVRIDGAKVFITNGGVADYYIVFGKWAPLGDGRDAISLVYVPGDTPGLTVDRLEDKMGHRGSATAALIFDNCIVPQSHMIGDPGAGLTMLHGFLDRSRPSVSAHALGIARAAFEDAISYVNERVQSGKRIVEFQGIQFLLADLAAELVMCENLLWSLAERVDRGKSISAVEASILKMRCSDLAMRATTEAVQLHGGYGYCRDFRVERLMRDAKVTQIWEGTNQIHRRIIGRSFVER